MNTIAVAHATHRLRALVLLMGALLPSLAAHAQPAQRPLLSTTVTARPNLMITLDNSASMTKPYGDDYTVGQHKKVGDAVWIAQRAAEINRLYYNPRITYLPRKDAAGRDVTPTDGVVFVSNQSSASFDRKVHSSATVATADAPVVDVHSSFSPAPAVPSGWHQVSSETDDAIYAPVHVAHRATDNPLSAPAFTYAVCTTYTRSTNSQACSAWNQVDLRYGAAGTVSLPFDNRRTDCGPRPATTCSTAQEINNVLNWYRYYLYRMSASVTAIGQALADPRLEGRLRIGYNTLNFPRDPNTLIAGASPARPQTVRGVRLWKSGSPDNAQLYDWLTNQLPMGATPLHRAIENIATYHRVPAVAVENPWAVNPAARESATNPELSCRRSYHLLLSDGAWSTSATTNQGENHDSKLGDRVEDLDLKGNVTSFQYDPKGDPRATSDPNRSLHITYPGPGTGGLADLTAKHRWHTDFRPDLKNQIPTSRTQPVFWQDITTYTVGYMIRPSGEEFGANSGLTFAQINDYETRFLLKTLDSTITPSWPSGELRNATESARVDDFIQAGFTGGGRGFSVDSAEGIRGVFDTVLTDILGQSGVDGGIALNGETESVNTTGGVMKYLVDYDTRDNVGNVRAQIHDKDGIPLRWQKDINGNTLSAKDSENYWTASLQIPGHDQRKVFSQRQNNVAFEFVGRVDALPAETRTALKAGVHGYRVKDDASFVNYLRGDRSMASVLDNRGQLLRIPSSPMGAIVNSPPLFLGDEGSLGYDTASTVDGSTSYAAFRSGIAKADPALYAATNAGMVHVLDAFKGRELAAFMPRRSLNALIDLAVPTSAFRYVLDGPLTAQDFYLAGNWHQVVTGTGGRGEQLVYALRAPLNADNSRAPSVSDFWWEAGPDTLDTLAVKTGYMTNPLVGGQTSAGFWVVLANSGHHNGTADGSRHGLLVLNARTGALLRSVALPTTYSAGRGLGAVQLILDKNQRVVGAYAGDANGQLWRFDLRGQPDEWRVSYNQPLLVTRNRRPIYARPGVVAHPKGGNMVVVGTGILLDETDSTDVNPDEAIYGVWDPTRPGRNDDPNFLTVTQEQLVEQHQLALVDSRGTDDYYRSTDHKIDWTRHRGWRYRLGDGFPGERVINNIGVQSIYVTVTTVGIDARNSIETCQGDTSPSTTYSLNALDGRFRPAFDIDGDGKLDGASLVRSRAGGYGRNVGMLFSSSHSSSWPTERQKSGLGRPESAQCEQVRVTIYGTGNGSINTGVDCETPGWSRQQYQLLQAPQ